MATGTWGRNHYFRMYDFSGSGIWCIEYYYLDVIVIYSSWSFQDNPGV